MPSRVLRLRYRFVGRDNRGFYTWKAELPGGGHATIWINPTWFWGNKTWWH